ncbi:MAG: hypothetical protein K6A42_08750 [Treponema sp.]|nr:hypothetical protein [Treponema sp.]
MKKEKIIPLKIMACVIISLAFFFFSWTPLQTELNLTPEWTSDINKGIEKDTNETLLPFRLGNKGGYFTHSGNIVSRQTIPYKAVYSRYFYSLYERNADIISVYLPSGQKKCEIMGAGFPFIQEDRLFLFAPGGSSIAFVNSHDGNASAKYENTAPITAFNSSENGSAVGYADGQFLIFNKHGVKKIELFPGGSDNPIILGADISKSGKMFACVSGVSPQRFVLYRDEGNYEKIIYHEFLSKNMTRQSYVHFCDNDKYVYYDAGEYLGIVDTEKCERKKVSLSGKILNIQESPVAESVYILSRIGQRYYTVTILENWTKKSGQFSFESDSAFILTDGNALYIGSDNKISKLALSKR